MENKEKKSCNKQTAIAVIFAEQSCKAKFLQNVNLQKFQISPIEGTQTNRAVAKNKTFVCHFSRYKECIYGKNLDNLDRFFFILQLKYSNRWRQHIILFAYYLYLVQKRTNIQLMILAEPPEKNFNSYPRLFIGAKIYPVAMLNANRKRKVSIKMPII